MFDVKNIQQYYRLGIRKIRKFLLSDKCKESLVFLFFVLVSFAFWMLQTLDDVYQTEFKVPLRLKKRPERSCVDIRTARRCAGKGGRPGDSLAELYAGQNLFPYFV